MRVTALSVALMAAVTFGAVAADWPQWRGADGSNVSAEKGWLTEGATNRTVWESAVGVGYSSVAVKAGKLYTAGYQANNDTIVCLDAAKGTVVWKHSYPCKTGPFPGTRATPTVDGTFVYTLSREGHLFAFDAGTGAVKWQRDLGADHGCVPPKWGYAGSPLVFGNAVVVNVGSQGVAVDKASGKTLWASEKEGAGYATVVPMTRDGKPSLLVFAAKSVVAVDAANGQKQWDYPWVTDYDVNAADPLVWEGKVLITSGYGHGGALLKVDGKGAAVVWENKTLASHFTSPILWKGSIYGATGMSGSGQLCCLDPATGEARWVSKDPGYCAFTLADGKLVLMNERGSLIVADAVPEGYHERFKAKVLDGTCWTPPVVCNGLVYVRNDKGRLLALDLTGKTPAP